MQVIRPDNLHLNSIFTFRVFINLAANSTKNRIKSILVLIWIFKIIKLTNISWKSDQIIFLNISFSKTKITTRIIGYQKPTWFDLEKNFVHNLMKKYILGYEN